MLKNFDPYKFLTSPLHQYINPHDSDFALSLTHSSPISIASTYDAPKLPSINPQPNAKPIKWSSIKKPNDYSSIIPAGIQFGEDVYKSFNYDRSSSDIMANTNQFSSSTHGVGYQMHENVDRQAELKNVRATNTANTFSSVASGAALGGTIGSIVPGIGTAIGAGLGGVIGGVASIFGGKKRKRDANETLNSAQSQLNTIDNFNRGVAASKGLQNEFYEQYGNPENQILITKDGVDYYNKKNNMNVGLAQTKNGLAFAPVNAIANGKEKIVNTDEERASRIAGDGKENKHLYLEEGDKVITDKFGLAKKADPYVQAVNNINQVIDQISNMANYQKTEASRGIANNVIKAKVNALKQERSQYNEVLKGIADEQSYLRSIGLLKQDPSYLPHASNGFDWGNVVSGIAGMATGLGQYINASSQKIKKPNSYVPNTYAQSALNTLGGLRIDNKPIMDEITSADAAAKYGIRNSGGLSQGQRHAMYAATTLNTQNAAAQARLNAQLQNNSYAEKYAQMKAAIGEQEAKSAMEAKFRDLDFYSKAHAAKLQGQNMGIYNIINAMQQYYANANKLGMFRDMYGLYAAGLTDDQKKWLAKYDRDYAMKIKGK